MNPMFLGNLTLDDVFKLWNAGKIGYAIGSWLHGLLRKRKRKSKNSRQ